MQSQTAFDVSEKNRWENNSDSSHPGTYPTVDVRNNTRVIERRFWNCFRVSQMLTYKCTRNLGRGWRFVTAENGTRITSRVWPWSLLTSGQTDKPTGIPLSTGNATAHNWVAILNSQLGSCEGLYSEAINRERINVCAHVPDWKGDEQG